MADTLQEIKRWDQRVDWTSNELSTRLMVVGMKQEIAELRAALASRPAEVDEAWVLLFEALPHISPHAINPAIARVGPIEDAYINTRIRKYLERVAAPSHTTNKEK